MTNKFLSALGFGGSQSAGVVNVSPVEASQVIGDRSGATPPLVLDVRTAEEFRDGHLPGAVNIDVSDPRFEGSVAALDRTRTFVVYCHLGGRSAAAVDVMARLGFSDVKHLHRGFAAWVASGLPVER